MSNATSIQDLMVNPINLQAKLVDHLESKTLGGTGVLVDPNSVAMHLIEGFSSITSDFGLSVQRALERRLPLRAQTDADLYLHMSDYESIGSFATPSKASIAFYMDKDYILRHGALINNSYRMVVIPSDTKFNLGNLDFSLYYPIRIQVDERTQIPLVAYDIETQNPLMALESNRVQFVEYKYLTYNLLIMYLTVYQFTKTSFSIPLNSKIGYSEAFTYNDSFYAVRLFTDYQGDRIELGQSLVQDNYDANRPTARLQVQKDTSKYVVNIPQVYFDNGYIGKKLYMDLYTTKGAITSNVGSLAPSELTINFNLDNKPSNTYTDPLKYTPTMFARVISPTTTEGSNGYSYEERRQRVVNSSFRTNAQITPIDIKNYYADYGIRVERYEDNLTNLMYFVYKAFVDIDEQIVPSTSTYLEISDKTIENASHINSYPDGTITVLPTAWFEYKSDADICTPVNDDVVKFMSEMDKETLVDEFNESSYVRTPFHVRLITSPTYPYATSFNLLQPTIEKVTVTDENPNALAQMLMLNEDITHEEEGAGGYKIRMIVKKDLMDLVSEQHITVYVYTQSSDGLNVGTKAEYIGMVDGLAIYEVTLKTSYWINDDNDIEITSLRDGTTQLNYKIPLESTFHMVYMCSNSYFPDVATPDHLYLGVPQEHRDQLVLLRQSMVVHLGHSLDDVVYNSINPTWDPVEYRRHEYDVPEIYAHDIYKTDENNVPILNYESGSPKLEILHKKGDPVIGADGEILYRHKTGDIWLDTDGKPVVISNRINTYLTTAAVFDGKTYISEHPTQIAFIKNMAAMFESYFDIIRDTRGYVTERTTVYFKPSKTMRSAEFQTGNGIKFTMDLDFEMSFRLHVDPVVNADPEIKESVTNFVVQTVEQMLLNDVISQTEMAKAIVDNVQFVESADALGINGDENLQTLQIVSSSGQPSIKRELAMSTDNTIIMKKNVHITFVNIR